MQATPPSAPPAQGQDQAQGAGPAEQAIKMIQTGFQGLGQLIQKSQGQLDPNDIKLFQAAVSATDNMIQSLTGPADSGPEPKSPSQPMPDNANAGAKPVPNQG